MSLFGVFARRRSPYLLDRGVHEAEVLRPSDHRPRDEVGFDQLKEGFVQVLGPVPAVVRQHVQQQVLTERRPDDCFFRQAEALVLVRCKMDQDHEIPASLSYVGES